MSEATAVKYAHTKAFVAHLAQEYPNYDTPGGTLQDAEDGGIPRANTDLVKKVVRLLEEEDEEALKGLIQRTFTIDDSDPALLDQLILDLMHKHKDDLQGVPFVFLSPMKRPISRPSSRASVHSYRAPRPDTPSSPLVKSLSLRRPHTPVASPLSAGLHAPPGILTAGLNGAVTASPGTSPTTANMGPMSQHFANQPNTSSQPGSPITSPHFLNAKAVEFRPVARPGSAMSGTFGRTDTPSPDLWAHRPNDIVPNSPRRVSSSLAIASPLGLESSYFPRPSSSLTRSNSGLRRSIRRGHEDDDDDEVTAFKRVDDDDHDEFSPFSKAPPINMPRSTANTHLNQFKDEPMYPYPAHLHSALGQDDSDDRFSNGSGHMPQSPSSAGWVTEPQDINGMASDGMTPFEVLHSIFGSTIPPNTLEEALNKTGYEFEAAMAWLIDNANGGAAPGRSASSPVPPKPVVGSGGRVMTVSRDVVPGMRPGAHTVASGVADPRYFGQRVAVATGGRVCRYYLAGECRRSDCRFSHDIERALCRFWLRGQCMKGEQCEFLHTLPQDIDVAPLANAMAGTDLNSDKATGPESPSQDAFPSLGRPVPGSASNAPARGATDPSRTRFAAAVKKQPTATVPPVPSPVSRTAPVLGVRRIVGDRTNPATPKPSPRLKLRPPSLLPTLPTGKVMNELYMSYRSKAIELGGQRNVALSRAAEAWKRGDGATAKHWSRQAHDLNSKMRKEMGEAAGKLVKERAKASLEAVAGRDPLWSDDPTDRSTRGKVAGAGLGVLLGVASASIGGIGVTGANLTSEERTECLLDLHGLHSSEGVEVLEEFLLALEREHYYGLAYAVVGEEKHTGTQDPGRGASRMRLAAGVKEFLHRWQYPWNERDGVVCIDPLTHAS